MIPQFLAPYDKLRLEDIDGAEGVLLEPLKFYSKVLKGVALVPAGFQTDFASIPRGLWNIFPKRGKHDRAAVLHDAAYRGALQTHRGQSMHVVKALADDLFREAMEAAGVGTFARNAMYRGVCWFGGGAYARAQRAKEQRTGAEVV